MPARPSPADPSLKLVLVGSMGEIGDNLYRLHQPAAALAQLDGVEVRADSKFQHGLG